MKQAALFFVFLLTLLSSCCNKTCQKSAGNNPLDSPVLVDTAETKSTFLEYIHRLIKQYPKNSTFILRCGYGYKDHSAYTNRVYINSGVFVIQPAYYGMFMGGKWFIDDMYPSHCFKISNRIVLLCSRSDPFMKQKECRKACHQIVSDSLHVRYEDLAFILVKHRDSKATLSSSDEMRKRKISPVSDFRAVVKFKAPEPTDESSKDE